MPEIWYFAKNNHWDEVKKLLENCSIEDLEACPQTGPDKNKTLTILAMLSERWDIFETIIRDTDDYSGEKTLEIANFHKIFELIALNRKWYIYNKCMSKAHTPKIDKKTFDFFLDQVVTSNYELEDDSIEVNALIDCLMHFIGAHPFPLSNEQFNSIVFYLLPNEYLPSSSLEKDGEYWIALNTFFSMCKDSNFQLYEEVLIELGMFTFGIVTEGHVPNAYFEERISIIHNNPELLLKIMLAGRNTCWYQDDICKSIEMKPEIYGTSFKGNETVKDLLEKVILLRQRSYNDYTGYYSNEWIKTNLDMLNLMFEIDAHNGLAFSPKYYQYIYDEIQILYEKNKKNILDNENIKNKFVFIMCSLIDAGLKIPNIQNLEIPIFETFERIAVIQKWQIQGTVLYDDIILTIGLDLISKELPELKNLLPECILIEKLQTYLFHRR